MEVMAGKIDGLDLGVGHLYEFGIPITVCHLPPGTSKRNKMD